MITILRLLLGVFHTPDTDPEARERERRGLDWLIAGQYVSEDVLRRARRLS